MADPTKPTSAQANSEHEALRAVTEAKRAAEHSYLKTKAHAERVNAAGTMIERLDEYQDACVVIDQAKNVVAILVQSAKDLIRDAELTNHSVHTADDKTFGAYYGVYGADESAAD